MTKTVVCDFCGRRFPAHGKGQRTCVSCAVHGAPDQSKTPWPEYLKQLKSFLAARKAAKRKKKP